MTYRMKNFLKNGTAQALTTAATTAVSEPIPMTEKDSKNFLARVDLAAASVTTGITLKLQESADNEVWEDVGSEASATVAAKTFAGGVAEITDITWPATAAAAQGDYVHITAYDGTTIAAWLDIDAAGTEPTGALYVAADEQITVPIVTGGSAADNAALARAALVANVTYAALFTTSAVSTATFTITQVNGGVVADPAPKSENDGGAGSITINVTTAGTDGGVNITTNRMTSTTHGYITGDPVIYRDGTLAVAPLVDGTIYYVIKVDANTLQLAETQALALAGTAIDLTDHGTGTQSLYISRHELRMNIEDSTDVAQLPTYPVCRVVATLGASDVLTVSAVWMSRRY